MFSEVHVASAKNGAKVRKELRLPCTCSVHFKCAHSLENTSYEAKVSVPVLVE